MKDNLEKAFKDKLDQFEAPYDASAWESMNARLDAQQSTGGSSLLKWIAGSAAVITVVSLAVYFSIDNTQQKEVLKADNQVNETINQAEDSSEKLVSNDVSSVKEEENINSNQTLDSEVNDVKVDDSQNEETVLPVAKESSKENNEANSTPQPDAENPNKIESQGEDNSNKPKLNFITGSLINDKVCKGESMFIRNTGSKNDIIRLQVNDDVFNLRKANAYEFTPKHSGTIFYLDGKNNVIGKEEYIVFDLPNPDFNLKANIFEDGLPVVEAETYGDYESIRWSFDGEYPASGIEAKHHFFSKGEHKVSLTVKDFNGCENTTTKTVRIDEDYNLMAVDAFRPNDMDPRNKVFMPIALTQRDVKFTLTIFDPRDNSVVFTTQDSNNGWDGRDERTGKMTPSETAYIWKVQLESDIPNERKVYAGTVVHD